MVRRFHERRPRHGSDRRRDSALGGALVVLGLTVVGIAAAADTRVAADTPVVGDPPVAVAPVPVSAPVLADTPVVAGRPDTSRLADPGAAVAVGRAPLAAAVAELERRLAADVATDGVGSIAAAVVVGDSVVWQAAFGRADREAGAGGGAGSLAAPTTIYRAGSITKSVTALVLLALVERGVVGLDDAVEPHVPELRGLAGRESSHRAITFRDLAAHTAGLAREPGTSHAARGPIRHWRRKLLAAIPATEARAAPGTGHHYSNIGYGLLGLALERAAGRPFETLVRELVLEPLDMTSSHFVVPRRDLGRLAVGYVDAAPDADGETIDPRVPRAEHRGRGYKVPNGGLYSTVGDLARLAMAMTGALGDTPVSAASRAIALADPGGPTDRVGYGLGFQLQRIGETTIAGHSGSVAGYTAYLAFDPATRNGVVILRNYNRGTTNLGAVAARTLLALAE